MNIFDLSASYSAVVCSCGRRGNVVYSYSRPGLNALPWRCTCGLAHMAYLSPDWNYHEAPDFGPTAATLKGAVA